MRIHRKDDGTVFEGEYQIVDSDYQLVAIYDNPQQAFGNAALWSRDQNRNLRVLAGRDNGNAELASFGAESCRAEKEKNNA